MNPSANGWIKKLLKEISSKQKDLISSETDFYNALKSSGFIYGSNISIIFNCIDNKDFTEEELSKIRPDLDGAQVMSLLGIKPSAAVGDALDFLMELRLEHGPLGEERATKELLDWWSKENPAAK